MSQTLPAAAADSPLQSAPNSAMPPAVTISCTPVTVDPADDHDCAGCHQRLEGPWAYHVKLPLRPAALTCPTLVCVGYHLEDRGLS